MRPNQMGGPGGFPRGPGGPGGQFPMGGGGGGPGFGQQQMMRAPQVGECLAMFLS